MWYKNNDNKEAAEHVIKIQWQRAITSSLYWSSLKSGTSGKFSSLCQYTKPLTHLILVFSLAYNHTSNWRDTTANRKWAKKIKRKLKHYSRPWWEAQNHWCSSAMSYSDTGEESTLHLQRLSWTFTPDTKQNASWWLIDNAGCYKRHFGGSEQVCKTPNSFLTTGWAEARCHGKADSSAATSLLRLFATCKKVWLYSTDLDRIHKQKAKHTHRPLPAYACVCCMNV